MNAHQKNTSMLSICFNIATLPETKIFAPENGWLEDFLVSFWVSAHFQGRKAVSFREGHFKKKTHTPFIWWTSGPFVKGFLSAVYHFLLASGRNGSWKTLKTTCAAFSEKKMTQLYHLLFFFQKGHFVCKKLPFLGTCHIVLTSLGTTVHDLDTKFQLFTLPDHFFFDSWATKPQSLTARP